MAALSAQSLIDAERDKTVKSLGDLGREAAGRL
jgi:hypothetical protein